MIKAGASLIEPGFTPSKPIVLKLKDKKSGKVKEVVKKYHNVIKSLGSEHPGDKKGGRAYI